MEEMKRRLRRWEFRFLGWLRGRFLVRSHFTHHVNMALMTWQYRDSVNGPRSNDYTILASGPEPYQRALTVSQDREIQAKLDELRRLKKAMVAQ